MKVTGDLPEDRAQAAQAAPEPSVDSLSDAQVLALCDSTLEPHQQEELSDLLAANREGSLTAEQKVVFRVEFFDQRIGDGNVVE